MAALIATYGYAAVFVGTFLEGETILVLAGLAAHRGYLELPGVIVAAALGTLASDQLFFFLGRTHGARLIERRASWKAASARVYELTAHHQGLVIFGFRFLYGLRTVSPIILGMIGIRPIKFVVLNIAGAATWAVAFGTLGYVSGQVLESVLGNVKKVVALIFGGVAAVGAIVQLIAWRRRRRKNRDSG